MSLDEMRSLQFDAPCENLSFSWTPREALDARANGDLEKASGLETLHDYLTIEDYRDVVCTLLLEVPAAKLPKPNEPMRIYRTADASCGATWGAILPGASVSESLAYVKRHADLHLDASHKVLSTMVYPDELLTLGNPHEFIYVPRNADGAYQRYLQDVQA